MAGKLYIVSTPIGNLDDVTFRALQVLREVNLIAAEDTRRTAKLLQHYLISTRTTSLHEHNERLKIPGLLSRLRAGDSLALVSDAGTPTVSDPGSRLVNEAHNADILVEPVPGPSAILAALASSGFSANSFTFLGYPPIKSKDRNIWLDRLTAHQETIVFFEAPHRLRRTLEEMQHILVDRPIYVGRELTKKYETLVKGPIKSIILGLKTIKGEFTIVVGPSQGRSKAKTSSPTDIEIATEFSYITETLGVQRTSGFLILARHYGKSRRAIYEAIERTKK